MHYPIHRLRAFVMLWFLTVIAPVQAADEAPSPELGRWLFSASLGVNDWGDLSDLDTTVGEEFDSVGFALEAATHKFARQRPWGDILVGVDFGLFGTSSDVSGVSEELTQRGLYLTPSVKLRFGDRTRRTFNLEAGIGWYKADIAELECDIPGTPCFELDDPFDENTIGGYVGASVGFNRWMFLSLKAHIADFGEVTGIDSATGSLGGPIYILSFGINLMR